MFCPFNSNITSRLPLLVVGSSSCSPLLFPVFHSVAFTVMGFAGESRHMSCSLQKAFSSHLIFRCLVDSHAFLYFFFFLGGVRESETVICQISVVPSPLCIPPLLLPDRQTITSGTCTICDVIATNILPAKFLMKKKKSLGGWLLHRHSARTPEPVALPASLEELRTPSSIIASDKHTASSSHGKSDKYPITRQEMLDARRSGPASSSRSIQLIGLLGQVSAQKPHSFQPLKRRKQEMHQRFDQWIPVLPLRSSFVSEEMSAFYKTCFNPILARSTSMQSGRNKRLLLSPFIQLGGCRMDWSQLIWQWQEASLLAQWPTFDKRREPSAAQSLATDWSLRCLEGKKKVGVIEEPVVPHCDTFVRQREGRNTCVQLHRWWAHNFFSIFIHILEVLGCTNDILHSPFSSPWTQTGEIFKGRIYGELKGRF